jgi:hypothetical protein
MQIMERRNGIREGSEGGGKGKNGESQQHPRLEFLATCQRLYWYN